MGSRAVDAKATAIEAKINQTFSKIGVTSKKFHASEGRKDKARIADFLKEVLCHGNDLFREAQWLKAAAVYTGCLQEADILEKMVDFGSDENISIVLQLLHSNRTEAMLRLRKHEEAAIDAEVALLYGRAHWKSWSRWGRALVALEMYKKASEIFTIVLKNCPNDLVIHEYLVFCKQHLAEARTGGEESNPVQVNNGGEHADFIGSVEMGRVGYGAGRRGLFATKLISAQELFLACKTICFSGMLSHFADSLDNANGRLFLKLMNVVKSKQSLAQLYILASDGEEERAIQSLGTLESHCEGSLPAACDLEVDLDRIRGIIELNAVSSTQEATDEETVRFQSVRPSTFGEGGEVQEFFEHAAMFGLWILPSLLNHSCVPNSMQMSIIEVKHGIALRDVQPGEELTISYIRNLFVGFKDRARKLPFECRCERCALEKKLDGEFSQINSRVGNLVPSSKEEFAKGQGTFRVLKDFGSLSVNPKAGDDSSKLTATKELSDLAGRVEVLIGALDMPIDPQQQGWIRAGFLPAYLAKFQLSTMSKMDESMSTGIEMLKVMVNAMLSVHPADCTLTIAHLLFNRVKARRDKDGSMYATTKELVGRVIRSLYCDEMAVEIWRNVEANEPQYDYSSFSFTSVIKKTDGGFLKRVQHKRAS